MEDSDWIELEEDQFRSHEQRLIENELKRIRTLEYNQSYVEGAEWANEHYKQIDISAIPTL